MERILITGASGFLGSYIAKKFLNEGFEIGVVKRANSNTWRVKSVMDKLNVFDLSMMSIGEVVNTFRPNHIIHTACSYGKNSSTIGNIIDSNLTFPIQLLDAAIINKVETFINTDTSLPKNLNPYSLSKAQFKEWLVVKSEQIHVLNLKIEHMYGPLDDNNKFIFWLIEQLKDNKISKIPLTDGLQRRDFIYIDDVVNAFFLALKFRSSGFLSYDISTGSPVQVKEFVCELVRQFEVNSNSNLFDKLSFGEVNYRENEPMFPIMDNSSLKRIGWNCKYDYISGINKLICYEN